MPCVALEHLTNSYRFFLSGPFLGTQSTFLFVVALFSAGQYWALIHTGEAGEYYHSNSKPLVDNANSVGGSLLGFLYPLHDSTIAISLASTSSSITVIM